jgi:hypothetical protein
MPKKKIYILVGDIKYPGRIAVKANGLDEALRKAEQGEFEVFEHINKCLAFEWNGNEDTVEEC